MKRFLVPTVPTAGKPVRLSSEEAHHARRVLRVVEDQVVEALNGEGLRVFAKIRFDGPHVLLDALPISPSPHPPQASDLDRVPIRLFAAVLKSDAMAWVIEKSVELGLEAITPVMTDRVVVQLDRKGVGHFVQRWARIADQALKQCGRTRRMEIGSPVSLTNLAASDPPLPPGPCLWLDEASGNASISLQTWIEIHRDDMIESGCSILVGPEGGWTEGERTVLEPSRWARVHMMGNILRAETASLYAASVLQHAYLAGILDKRSKT